MIPLDPHISQLEAQKCPVCAYGSDLRLMKLKINNFLKKIFSEKKI
jgi:hypothetical protein